MYPKLRSGRTISFSLSDLRQYRDIQFSPDTTVKVFQETLASKLSLLRFRLFAQGREITRKESEQVKTLQEWGFKDLEAVMIQVQERAKEVEPQVRKVSNCELWVSTRFEDLHRLLSGEPKLAYVVNRFLIVRPPEPKLVEKLRNLETPWEHLFSFLCPWDLHYTLSVLQHCVERFRKDEPEFKWVAAYGDKYHDKIIQLVEWLSQPPLATSAEWPYSFGLAVSILNVLMVKCTNLLLRFNDRRWISMASNYSSRTISPSNVKLLGPHRNTGSLPFQLSNEHSTCAFDNGCSIMVEYYSTRVRTFVLCSGSGTSK